MTPSKFSDSNCQASCPCPGLGRCSELRRIPQTSLCGDETKLRSLGDGTGSLGQATLQGTRTKNTIRNKPRPSLQEAQFKGVGVLYLHKCCLNNQKAGAKPLPDRVLALPELATEGQRHQLV